MKNDYLKIVSFAKKVQLRIIIRNILSAVLLSTCLFSLFTAGLNLVFYFLPLLFIPLIWDISAVLFTLSFVFSCFYYFLKKPTLVESIKSIEEKGANPHPMTALALELSTQPQNIFTNRTIAAGNQQIENLKSHFPNLIKSRKLSGFSILSIILSVSTVFLPLSAVDHWYIPFANHKNTGNITITPGTKTIAQYAPVKLTAMQYGSEFPSCRLGIRPLTDNKEKRCILLEDQEKQFSFSIDSVRQSFVYQFSFGRLVCEADTIIVAPVPSLFSLDVSVKPPQYTGSSVKKIPSGQGDFAAYEGSEVTIDIESVFLKCALFVLDNDTISMSINKTHASVSFTMQKQSSYTFVLTDTLNQKNDSLKTYSITVLPDELPSVQIVYPGFNKNLTPLLNENVVIEAVDDFGVKYVNLLWKKSSEPESVQSINLSAPKNEKLYKKEYGWDMSGYNLYPGDTVFYFVTVSDNWPYTPAHKVTSDTFWFRIPGFDEIHEKVIEKEKHAESILREAIEKSESIREAVNELPSCKSETNEPNYEQKQQIDKISQDMKSQADSLNKALSDLSESADELRKQGVLNDELAEKMEAIQKMVEELVRQYGDSLFTAADKEKPFDMKDLKDAIEKAKKMLPDLEQDLENTLRFLEALKQDKLIATLSMKAQNLARDQEQMLSVENSDQSRKNQENILDNIQELNKEISESLDKSQMQSVNDQLNSINAQSSSMNSSIKNDKLPQNTEMSLMSSSLLSLSEKLQDMTISAQQMKMEKERKIILKTAYDLLTLNDWLKLTSELQGDTSDYKKSALMLQTIIDAQKKVRLSCDSLTVLTPQLMQQIGSQLNRSGELLVNVLRLFEHYNRQSLIDQVSDQFLSLANFLLSIASSQNEEQKSCNSGSQGMMSGMRKLSQKQAGINSATSELLRALMMGNKQGTQPGQTTMSAAEKQQLEKARQEAQDAQKKIADELDRLQKEGSNEVNSEQIKKRIEELKKDAENIAKMLSDPHPEVIEKQNEFLNRMLQSALSMNKRDELKEERKSESSKTTFTVNQAAQKPIAPSTPDQFYQLKRRALQGVYPENYRSEINAYFDSLEIIYLRNNEKKSAR